MSNVVPIHRFIKASFTPCHLTPSPPCLALNVHALSLRHIPTDLNESCVISNSFNLDFFEKVTALYGLYLQTPL